MATSAGIERYPLGVVAAITSLNFPNIVPNWSIPNAIALGSVLVHGDLLGRSRRESNRAWVPFIGPPPVIVGLGTEKLVSIRKPR